MRLAESLAYDHDDLNLIEACEDAGWQFRERARPPKVVDPATGHEITLEQLRLMSLDDLRERIIAASPHRSSTGSDAFSTSRLPPRSLDAGAPAYFARVRGA